MPVAEPVCCREPSLPADIAEQLLADLPKPPRCSFWFGRFPADLPAQARRQGFLITHIVPNLTPSGSWEALRLHDAGYGTILFQDSIRYLNILSLFAKAYRALDEVGRLIILDIFALDRYAAGYDGYPALDYFIALAERCGLELQKRRHLSSQGLPPPASAENDRRADGDGRHGYFLLEFKKNTALRWRISDMRTEDMPAVMALFQRVFEYEIRPVLWQWKYSEERGQNVICWAGDRVVAHYGGLTRPIDYMGRPAKACQITDVMVESGERAVLTRKGPFFLTGASQSEVSRGKHVIGFGFPTARHMRLAARLGLYAEVGRIIEIFWTPLHTRPSFTTNIRRITRAKQLDCIVEPLWQAMRAGLRQSIVGVRDAAWLSYRYLSHPVNDYHLLSVFNRITRKSLGLIVLRRDSGRCELLDVIAPLERIPLLLWQARRLAGKWGASELFCWISRSHAEFFERCQGQRRDLDLVIPTSIWTEDPGPAVLQDRWWLMSGDTDFR